MVWYHFNSLLEWRCCGSNMERDDAIRNAITPFWREYLSRSSNYPNVESEHLNRTARLNLNIYV